jgi:hypothetical protein
MNPRSNSLWDKRFLYPWIKIDSLSYYCSHCSTFQKKHLMDSVIEETTRFLAGHSHCTLPPKKEPVPNDTIAPIDTPPQT